MARYPIIMRDQTYEILLKMAADRGMTMGKFLNQVLENASKETLVPSTTSVKKIENPCGICGHESAMTLEHVTSGYKKLFCQTCGQNALESHKWKVL